MKQQNIQSAIDKNVEIRRKLRECITIMNKAIDDARELCEKMVFSEIEMHVIEAAKEYGRFLESAASDERFSTEIGRKELSEQKVKLESQLIERIMMMQF